MEFFQAKVLSPKPTQAVGKKGYVIDVILLPSFIKLTQVSLTRTITNQIQPMKDDIVLVWVPRNAPPVCTQVLKDSEEILGGSLRSEVKDGGGYFQPGEIQHESKGGAYHYLSNKGDHQIVAGNLKEKIAIEASSETVLAEGSNIDIRTVGNCRILMDE